MGQPDAQTPEQVAQEPTQRVRVHLVVDVEVTLERVVWHHLQSEDYYVRAGGRDIGMVGDHPAGQGLWSVWTASAQLGGTRGYPDRDTAVAALVRHHARVRGQRLF